MNSRGKRFLVCFGVVMVCYIVWIVWPHVGQIKVTNHAGITSDDVTEVVGKLEADGMFRGRGDFVTVVTSLIDPRSRLKYFVEINGSPKKVVVTAGYSRGPLWGGGRIVEATKVDGLWVFDSYSVLWKN